MNHKLQYGTLLILLLSSGFDARPAVDIKVSAVDTKVSAVDTKVSAVDTKESTMICDRMIENTGNDTGNVTCSMCHVLVNIIDAEIKYGNHTIVEITEVIEKICSIIKGPSGVTCELVVKNIQNIIKWISSGMPSNQICVKMHLCNSTNIKSVNIE